MKKIATHFKVYAKDYFIVFTVLVLGVIAVMGFHWMDSAKTKAGWTFWQVATGISLFVLIAGWIILWAKQPKRHR